MSYLDTQDLKNYRIQAQDGEIGKINDIYFDEDLFYLRYLVVDTQPFLLRNLVLVSPIGFHKINEDKKNIDIYITKKELENSPPIDCAQTVSRQYEKAYNEYFSWPNYWLAGVSAWSIGPYGIPWKHYGDEKHLDQKGIHLKESAKENSLRSGNEIQTYSIKGLDEEFGHIQSYILDTKTLSIEYFVIDTINYMPSKLVLLRPEWITDISWHEKTVSFPFTKEQIKSAPAYKRNQLSKSILNESDEHFLDHLQKMSDLKIKHNSSISVKRKNLQPDKNEHKVVGDIPSGLFVVTVDDKKSNQVDAFVASWVQQASFEPLLVSLCIKEGRPGLESILNKEQFCINVLAKEDTKFLKHFFNQEKEMLNDSPLKQVQHKRLNGRGAVIEKAKSAIICKPFEIYKPGDHYLVTAKVKEGIVIKDDVQPKIHFRKSAKYY